METSTQKFNRKFGYKNYLTWTYEKDRWELINDAAYDISPAPVKIHQLYDTPARTNVIE